MKKLYLNLMLLVCMMSMGMNAWGQTTTLYERGLSTPWSDSDLSDWVLSGTADSSIESTGLKFAKTATARTEYTYTKSFETSENANVSMNLAWHVENANGSATAGCYFQLGDVKLFWCGQNRDLKITIGGVETALITGGNTNLRGTVFNVSLSINKASKAVNYSISSSLYNSGNAIEGTGTVSSSEISSIIFGWSRGGQQNVSSQIINNISISEEVQAVSTVEYTINYKKDDIIVKTVSSSNIIGSEIFAQKSFEGDGEFEDQHFLIISDEVPSIILTADASSNVLNVPVRSPYSSTLNITTTIGTEESTTITTNFVETDDKVCSWSYAYPLYVKGNDGLYYKADNTTTFGEGGTFVDGEVINKTITYTNADADAVYFREATSNVGTNYAYSNGESGFVGAQNARDRGISVGTLPAGTYEFVVNITAANRRSLVIRQGANDPLASVGTSDEDKTTGIKTAQFELTEETSNLFINGANSGEVKTNQSEDFDYVLIRKVASTVPVTISAAGYATFASDKALDLSNLPEGLTAYVATSLSSDAVTINPITTAVAPGTGLIFGGAAGDYEVPVASEGTEVTDNMLVGVVGEAVTLPQDGTCYVLALNAESKAVFQQVTTKAAASVPVGKAYLNTATTSPAPARQDDMPGVGEVTLAKTLNIYLPGEGDATAIKTVETEGQFDGAIYNLAGQRVGKDYKGIVIMNGKKYLVK